MIVHYSANRAGSTGRLGLLSLSLAAGLRSPRATSCCCGISVGHKLMSEVLCRQVIVRRVSCRDATDASTRYRYQAAFLYTHYTTVREAWQAKKAQHDAVERRYLSELGYGFLIRAGLKSADTVCVTLCPKSVAALRDLSRRFHASQLDGPEGVCASEEWKGVMRELLAACRTHPRGTFDISSRVEGWFARIEETSAKDFKGYWSLDAVASRDTLGFTGAVVYGRVNDVPFRQRQAHRAALTAFGDLPAVPAPRDGADALPALNFVEGAGPHRHWATVLAALVVDEKIQAYATHHAVAETPLHLYLNPWDSEMDTSRELRCYTRHGRVVAIGPWYHASIHSWIDLLSDADLATLARDVASYVESEIVPLVQRLTSFCDGTFTADVLVPRTSTPTDRGFRLVEVGSYGACQAVGSTLFQWLEFEIFGDTVSAADPEPCSRDQPIEIRVLAREPVGVCLSAMRPVPEPDILRM
jgi:hypothetical protein